MAYLMLKEIPRYECLLEAATAFPDLDPSAVEAFLHLLRAGDEAFRFANSWIERNGLSAGRFMILMQLLDKSTNQPVDRTPKELAEQCGIRPATVTGLIDTLSRSGLVTVAPSVEDRRRKVVRLTGKARGLLDRVLPTHFRRLAELMSPLSENDRKSLVRILNKMMRNTDALSDNPAA